MAEEHKKFKYAIEVRGLPDTTPSSLVRQLRIILLTHKVEDFWLKLVETPGKKTRMCLITFRNEADAAYCARKFNNYKFTLDRKNKPTLTATITAKMIKNYDRSRSPNSTGIEVWNNSQGSGMIENDSLSKLDMEIELLKKQRSVVEEERKLLMERKKIEMLMEYSQAPILSDNSGYIEMSQPFVDAPKINRPLLPTPMNQDFIQNPFLQRPVVLNEPMMRDVMHRGRSPVNVQYSSIREVDRREPPQRVIYGDIHTDAIKPLNPPQFGSINVGEPIRRDELRYRERSPERRPYESREYNTAPPRPISPPRVFNTRQFGSASGHEQARNETRRIDETSHARRDNPHEYKEIHRRQPSPHALQTPMASVPAFKSQQFVPASVTEPVLRDEFRHRGRSPARNFDSRGYTEDVHVRHTLPQMVPRPSEYPIDAPSYNSRQSPPRRTDVREYNDIHRRQPSPAQQRPVKPVWDLNKSLGPNTVKNPDVERDDLRRGRRSPLRKHEYNRNDPVRQPSPRAMRGPDNHEIRKPVWETNDKFEPRSVRDPPVEREVRYRERSPLNRRDTREYNKGRQPSPRPVQRSTNEIRKPVWETNEQFVPAVSKPVNERDEFRYRERQNDSREYNRDNDHRQPSPRAGPRPTNREGNKPIWEPNEQYRPKEAAVERGRERSPGRRQELREYDRDLHRRQLSPRADPRPVIHEGRKPTWESNPIKESLPEREVRYRERSPPPPPRIRQPSPRAVQRSSIHETKKPVWELNEPFGRPYEKEPVERGFGDRERMKDRRPREREPAREVTITPNVPSMASANNGRTCTRKQRKRNRLAVPSRVILMTMSEVMERYASKHELTKLLQMAQLAISNRYALVKQDKYIACLDDAVALYRSAYPSSTDEVFIKDLLNTIRTGAVPPDWEPESKRFDDFTNRRMAAREEKSNLRTSTAERNDIDDYGYAMEQDWNNMEDDSAWKAW